MQHSGRSLKYRNMSGRDRNGMRNRIKRNDPFETYPQLATESAFDDPGRRTDDNNNMEGNKD